MGKALNAWNNFIYYKVVANRNIQAFSGAVLLSFFHSIWIFLGAHFSADAQYCKNIFISQCNLDSVQDFVCNVRSVSPAHIQLSREIHVQSVFLLSCVMHKNQILPLHA